MYFVEWVAGVGCEEDRVEVNFSWITDGGYFPGVNESISNLLSGEFLLRPALDRSPAPPCPTHSRENPLALWGSTTTVIYTLSTFIPLHFISYNTLMPKQNPFPLSFSPSTTADHIVRLSLSLCYRIITFLLTWHGQLITFTLLRNVCNKNKHHYLYLPYLSMNMRVLNFTEFNVSICISNKTYLGPLAYR